MRIVIYYAFPLQKRWTGSDIDTVGLPGTETAIVHMASHLARLSSCVTVVCRSSGRSVYRGATYVDHSDFDLRREHDAFVLTRGTLGTLAEVNAPVKAYWSFEEDRSLIRDWPWLLKSVDTVMTLSDFHTERVKWRCSVPPEKIWQTRLGVDSDDYSGPLQGRKVSARLIYCSVPGKGLRHLRPIFRRIKEHIPSAEIVITGDYSLWGRDPCDGEYRKLFAGVDGVTYLGKIERRALIELQKSSSLHVHPADFEELFCLPAIECQASGTPCIASRLGALQTTVCDGMTGLLVDGQPGTPAYTEDFSRKACCLLSDAETLGRMAQSGRDRALSRFSYRVIAGEWMLMLKGLVDAHAGERLFLRPPAGPEEAMVDETAREGYGIG